MEWEIIIHKEAGYLEVVTKGVADKEGSLNMAKDIARAAQSSHMTRTLVDHQGVEAVVGSATEIFNRPKLFGIIGAIMRIRIAVITRPEHENHFKFFETVCLNQGYQVSVFYDKGQALTWLLP